MTKNRAIKRLKEIQDEISSLASEADRLVRNHAESHTYSRANAYWIPWLKMSISSDHSYLGGVDPNMEKTIKEMEEE